jgi:WD40 region of Ge1, enhancer of mRNA-decapping protein
MSEPFGTTPLPISLNGESSDILHVKYSPSDVLNTRPQQPLQQEIASFTAERADHAINGASILAVNQHFIVYAVKNGLIRVLHRHSAMKALLRDHHGEVVSDIQFFQDGEILATVGATDTGRTSTSEPSTSTSSKVIVWRIFERASEIVADQMLEIRSNSIQMTRVVWHPFNPNQFWMIHCHGLSEIQQQTNQTPHTATATLVETTRVKTRSHPDGKHALAGCMVLQHNSGASLHDLVLEWM